MKKKKSTKSSFKSATESEFHSESFDLKSLIHDHCLFFDKLVESIPARFYLPAPDDKPWFQGLSKQAKASAKLQSREKLKLARRARHDPLNPPLSTLERQQQQNQQPLQKLKEEQEQSQVQCQQLQKTTANTTYEELRQKLSRKIEMLGASRSSNPESNRSKKRKLADEGLQNESKNKSKKGKGSDLSSGNETKSNKKNGDCEAVNVGGAKKDSADSDLMFGQVKVGTEKKKKKKMSKEKELARAKKLEEMKKDPERGEKVAKKQSWKTAVSRAAGEKVHDDAKLIKESMKRERKLKQKHAGKWKERAETVEKARKEKQKTRKENIKGRIQQKKQRRIEKREKKLMRPGFEGRKKGYINE